MTIWAVLPAAGIGRRMGSSIPKQYLELDGVPLLLHALRRLNCVSQIQKTVIVIHPEDSHWANYKSLVDAEFAGRILVVSGAEERYQSVLNGLNALQEVAKDEDWVLVHDAVRPCVRTRDIEALIQQVKHHSVGGLLGSEVDNTLKRVDEKGTVLETVDRQAYWNALTPQMFRFSLLRDSLQSVVASGLSVTDEAAAVEAAGLRPLMVAGHKDNIKITHAADLLLAKLILDSQVGKDESE